MSYLQPVDEPCSERQEILAIVDHIAVIHILEIDAVSKGDMEEWEAIGHNLRKATEFKDSGGTVRICNSKSMRPHKRSVRAGATV